MSNWEDKKAHCKHCQREYDKQNMMQDKKVWTWLCLKCHNLATKEAA